MFASIGTSPLSGFSPEGREEKPSSNGLASKSTGVSDSPANPFAARLRIARRILFGAIWGTRHARRTRLDDRILVPNSGRHVRLFQGRYSCHIRQVYPYTCIGCLLYTSPSPRD